LRAALAELAATQARSGQAASPFAHLQLAIQARAFGLDRELWQHLEHAIAVPRDQEHSNLRRRVDDFLAQLEPELLARRYRNGDTATRVQQLLQRAARERQASVRAAVEELLVREANADKDLRLAARRDPSPERRMIALDALLRRETAGNDRFAWRTAILDAAPAVREHAARRSRACANQTRPIVDYLAPGLMHPNPEVRVRTAEAFANLGDVAAVKLLVMAGPNASKALAAADEGVRGYAAFVTQQAYIRDFDVEVAQASFIADPQIATLQSGTVLDVTVHGVVEEVRIVRVYRQSLQRLAGADPGPNPRDWAAWLARTQEQQPSAPAPTTGKGNR
jgi:hypothetical protein